ncbi:ABC transporter ATP-binding protein [Raoultibacter phocaeensis]|uniref:ABC transporter ATP-binding protein n=1 Tax=Raoultibacter phocaeensis TaxID=2479841 RepID=UPI0015D5EB6F
MVAITGVSGKGKTTLLSVMGGILRPDAGAVLYRGENLACASAKRLDALHRQGIGFVFQSPYLFQALTVEENLLFSAKVQRSGADAETIGTALEEFGLADRKGHLPCELSVGQKRRLVIARTLLAEHDLILADEPTNDLDATWSDYVFEKLKNVAAQGEKAVVVVTHDEAYARRADAVYALDKGALMPLKEGCS